MWMLTTMNRMSSQQELVLRASPVTTGQCSLQASSVSIGCLTAGKIWVQIWIWNLDFMFIMVLILNKPFFLISLFLKFFFFFSFLEPAIVSMKYNEMEIWRSCVLACAFYVCVCVCVAQLCPTLWDPMGYSPPGTSVHGILQAIILEWVAIPFSRESTWPRNLTGSPALQSDSLPAEPPEN